MSNLGPVYLSNLRRTNWPVGDLCTVFFSKILDVVLLRLRFFQRIFCIFHSKRQPTNRNLKGKHALVFLGLGGNLGDVAITIDAAIAQIETRIGTISARSKFYDTAPVNHPQNLNFHQPRFLNSVIACTTELSPQQLLETVLKIESELGRDRNLAFKTDVNSAILWGPRLIDIDILTYNQLHLKSATLTIPHPEMHRRLFVLEPLREIAPNFIHPVLKVGVQQMIENC